jgi:hypothetical protein
MLYKMNTFSYTEYCINTVFDGNSRFTETVNCVNNNLHININLCMGELGIQIQEQLGLIESDIPMAITF